MERRKFIRAAGLGLALSPVARVLGRGPAQVTSGLKAPVTFYNDWSSYDELSDNTPLTETLAMKELEEVIRLQHAGVHFDYYMMDAFWFDKNGGYRTWHHEHWPNGPDAWLNGCKAAGIKPGMWFSTNLIATHSGLFLNVIPEWKDSLATDGGTFCLFVGGYLKHLADSLQLWYDKGVRAFKFDFAYFDAATAEVKQTHLPETIIEMNKLALMDMLGRFRVRNPDVIITGYNGFGGDMENTFTPFRKTVDPRWMETFDTIYCGDPRFSDVPAMNIWRSGDIYTDHMVRQFEFNGLPLRRIDNCGFMTGKTGTCYYRADHAWKGMMVLEMARAGWMNVFHGNMELVDGPFFAKAQALYHGLQQYGLCSTFGAIPGTAQPYGFKAEGINGTVLTLVNPSQTVATMDLPAREASGGKILYADGGFTPVLKGRSLDLGPEQLVVVGYGTYASETYNLGIDTTIHIPQHIAPVPAEFSAGGPKAIKASITVPASQHIRIFFQQFGSDGFPRRSWGGAPPDGKKMDAFLQISLHQDGRDIPFYKEYDKMIWSGLSWGAGEVDPAHLDASKPLEVVCRSTETDTLQLKAWVYAVTY
jgi:hypothetical protein